MRIYFADSSNERGQYNLLFEENATNGLFSYAYQSAAGSEWRDLWSKFYQSGVTPHIHIDSGAFTAFTKGKPIKPKDYGKWALNFYEEWHHKAELQFFNLDVIGDQQASWRNQIILEGMGLNPLPIITYGADLSHLDRALENYPYIALGGLVPYARQKKKLRAWLDYCFSRITKRYKHDGVYPKVHLLGVTQAWALNRYPCYSSDSSSWLMPLRQGEARSAGIKRLPKYTSGEYSRKTNLHALRSEIRRFQRMEQEATNLWKSRGIVWKSDQPSNARSR